MRIYRFIVLYIYLLRAKSKIGYEKRIGVFKIGIFEGIRVCWSVSRKQTFLYIMENLIKEKYK